MTLFFASCFICVMATPASGIFFFKQKTAYEMRISDWSSDVCSSDLSRLADGLTWLPSASLDGCPLRFEFQALCRISLSPPAPELQIGRASCRERVCQYV